jgi:hypothetical protein
MCICGARKNMYYCYLTTRNFKFVAASIKQRVNPLALFLQMSHESIEHQVLV